MADARRWLTVSLGLGVAIGMAQACILPDPDHCSNSDVPCGVNQVCDPCTPSTIANGCVEASARVDVDLDAEGCQVGVSGPMSTETESSVGEVETTVTTTGTTETTTIDVDTTSTTTDVDPTTSTGVTMCMTEGMYGGDCVDASEPFCVMGTCRGCDDTSDDTRCSAFDEAPGDVCNADGRCVVCNGTNADACAPTAQVCGPDLTCVNCTEHAQCPDDAGCDLFAGRCLSSTQVIYASDGAMGCDNMAGTPANPTCTLGAALTLAAALPEATVRVAPGDYDETLNVTGGTIALIGEDRPTITAASSGPPTFSVFTTVYFAGLDISGAGNLATSDGIAASGNVWVDDSQIDFNTGIGIDMEAGSAILVVRRSRLLGNSQGGIRAAGMSVEIESSILGNNGNSGSPAGGVTTVGGTTLDVLYSTFAENLSSGGEAIQCNTGGGTVRNSIVVSGLATTIDCVGALAVTYTATDSMAYAMEGNNLLTTTADLDFFDLGLNDFHIMGTSSASGVALWVEGDPTSDIDGDPRPFEDGPMDFAGADVP